MGGIGEQFPKPLVVISFNNVVLNTHMVDSVVHMLDSTCYLQDTFYVSFVLFVCLFLFFFFTAVCYQVLHLFCFSLALYVYNTIRLVNLHSFIMVIGLRGAQFGL